MALLVRALLLIVYPFDGLYTEDSYFYLVATRRLVDVWTAPERLLEWLTVRGGSPISNWPLGFHIQMALAANLTGLNAASGQAVSLLAGVLTPVWTALLAWKLKLHGQGENSTGYYSIPALAAALLAGLIMAFSPLAVGASLVAMADMSGVHWATLGVLLAVTYFLDERERPWLGLLAGLCLGLAAVTRYIYPLLLTPVALFAIVGARGNSRQGSGSLSRQVGKLAIVFAMPILLLSLQLLHNWMHPTPGLPSPVIGTWDPLNAFRSNFEGPDGRQSYDQPIAIFYLLRPLMSTTSIGPALALFVVLGLIALVSRSNRRAAALLLSWWLLFAGFYSGTIYQADRFVLSYLPPMAIIAGFGLALALEWLWRLRESGTFAALSLRRSELIVGFLALLPVIVGLALQARSAWTSHQAMVAIKGDYLAATRCLDNAAPANPAAPVFSFGVTFALEEYTQIDARELYFESPDSIEKRLATNDGEVRGLLAIPKGFEGQWGETPMGEAVRHITENYELAALPCPGTTFSLFEIR
jgi:4-amino-4-deoxy-L-arabinose transferase-like glycosyltransferase